MTESSGRDLFIVDNNVSGTIDWTSRESVRAKLRLAVKRVLRKWHAPDGRASNRMIPSFRS